MKINCRCTAVGQTERCLECLGDLKVDAKVGMDVYYVPRHRQSMSSKGYIIPQYYYPDVERGFITSIGEEFVFCRYFTTRSSISELRTRANSEPTNPGDLWQPIPLHHGSHRRKRIKELLKELSYG